MTKPTIAALALCLFGQPAAASPTDEPHLQIPPRNAAEIARILAATRPDSRFDAPNPFELNPAGAATTRPDDPAHAFSLPSATIPFEDQLDFEVGNGLFRKIWVSSPSSTLASDGLGPLYNARSCQRCHLNDGRGHAPAAPGEAAAGLVLRLGQPTDPRAEMARISAYLAPQGDPNYGNQIQDLSLAGLAAEAKLAITYTEIEIALSGGEIAHLRQPDYALSAPAFGPLAPQTATSARIAPQMIGLGLIEAIPAADILAREDPEDADGDGISGRANIVWSKEFAIPMLGRFGHKASIATLMEQSSAAFSNDIGISTPLHPAPWGDCTPAQSACRNAPHGDGDVRVTEIDQTAMDLLAFYAGNLGVPARPGAGESEVLLGKEIFYQTGCIDCHRPSYVTHRLAARRAHSFQLIWPYSDFLLHDMGPGLADALPEGRARGTEWRTPPLWGIGHTKSVSGQASFLHDGRARSLLEAVLWHDGEAARHRESVIAMPPDDRAALIRFLESL